MKPTLKQLESRDGEPVQLATAILSEAGNWLDAVAIYLNWRRKDCEVQMANCATINVGDWAARIKGIADITTKLGEVEAFRAEVRHAPGCPSDEQARLARLSALLCPPGWSEHYGAELVKLRDAAAAALIRLEDAAQNQATYQEVDRLLIFLGSVDKQGTPARFRLGEPEPARAGVTQLRADVIRREKTTSPRKLRAAAANQG